APSAGTSRGGGPTGDPSCSWLAARGWCPLWAGSATDDGKPAPSTPGCSCQCARLTTCSTAGGWAPWGPTAPPGPTRPPRRGPPASTAACSAPSDRAPGPGPWPTCADRHPSSSTWPSCWWRPGTRLDGSAPSDSDQREVDMTSSGLHTDGNGIAGLLAEIFTV